MKPVELTLERGEVLLGPELKEEPLSLAGGLIVEQASKRRVDAFGFRILPGIVDIHGDGFERHLAPRRGAMTDRSTALVPGGMSRASR